MYSQETQKQLIDLSTRLLNHKPPIALSGAEEFEEIENLRQVIRYHEWRYYIL